MTPSEDPMLVAASPSVAPLRRDLGVHAVHALLLALIFELACNRLAVPLLGAGLLERRPPWFVVVQYAAIFSLYLSILLGLYILGRSLVQWFQQRIASEARVFEPREAPQWLFVVAAVPFIVVNGVWIASTPNQALSDIYRTLFSVLVVCLLALNFARVRDWGTKIGVGLFIIPLLIPYFTVIEANVLGDDNSARLLIDDVERYGVWAMCIAGIACPYVLGPRPMSRWMLRLPPLAMAAMTGALAGWVAMRDEVVWIDWAAAGLGVELNGAEPFHHIAIYLSAIIGITWTLVACTLSSSSSRRMIGVGVALVVLGGYGFEYPTQFLVQIAGLLTIIQASRTVVEQEREYYDSQTVVAAPAIDEQVWAGYVSHVNAAISHDGGVEASIRQGSDANELVNTIETSRDGYPVHIKFKRVQGAPSWIDIWVGERADEAEMLWQWGAERKLEVQSSIDDAAGEVTQELREYFRLDDPHKITERLVSAERLGDVRTHLQGRTRYAPGVAHCRIQAGLGESLVRPVPIMRLSFADWGAIEDDVEECVQPMVALVDTLIAIVRAGGVSDSES